MSEKVGSLEKKVFAAAILFAAVLLGLIVYASLRLGISVPTCVTDVKPFTEGSLIKISDRRYEIHVLAKMWNFEPNRIRLPVGSIADIYVVSKDVTHGFHINGTNVNLMALPFVVNHAQVKFDRPGIYPILCHEYCGTGHQAMSGVIEVRDDIKVGEADGLSSHETVPTFAGPGRKLYETKGCIACHSLDGKHGVGPTFKGIWGRNEEFTDGTTHVIDAAYIRQSILNPPKTVKGFLPIMPKLPVNDAEIGQLIEFMKTVK